MVAPTFESIQEEPAGGTMRQGFKGFKDKLKLGLSKVRSAASSPRAGQSSREPTPRRGGEKHEAPKLEDPEEDEQLRFFRAKLAECAAQQDAESHKTLAGEAYAALDKLALSPGRKTAEEKPLHIAVRAGNLKEVSRLLNSKGCDVDCLDGKDTAMHLASKNAMGDIVDALINAGANVDAVDVDGWTPLHHAAANGHPGICNLLLRANADLMSITPDGMTPLHCSAHLRNSVNSRDAATQSTFVIEELVKWGMDINEKDYQGWTILHLAVQGGSLDIVRQVLQLGADVNLVDNNGLAPISYVPMARGLFHQNKEMEALLRSHVEISAEKRRYSHDASSEGPTTPEF